MTISKGKRPRDPNQLAKWIVDQSTSEAPVAEPETSMQTRNVSSDISEYMAKIGRKGGQIGGKRRLETMSGTKRRKIASEAAKARWKKAKKKPK
jgi:hypothetical protein